ncbi:putative N-ethylmaleimide reductase [Ilyonectria robusta]|uniref:putative N-ethylmaleimide reductase n=1 Tax=Ilyonectria robusta TaxID=1079257 RepID=UPI001E8ED7F6|nr:putative N-ethylmaleimide reductase [Ilyonectria robusta]KAH8688544.1 putative N-ethylmaleimide reductase [Ilyonectria robusta]
MVSISHPSTDVDDDIITNERFHFISITNPDDAKDRKMRRDARSHAVKQALKNKRMLQQESRDNFRIVSSNDYAKRLASKRRRRPKSLVMSPYSLSAGALDPFQTLAVDSSRLQVFLGDYKARQAAEPVFSVADELAFHSFREVFQTGLDDPALLNAVMLTFAFAATEGTIDRECLGYQSEAMGYIRERMSSLDRATSASTIGAILLLAGVEAQRGMQFQVQLHMTAIQQLLDICRRERINLAGGIKRAIFWQDLNSSVMTGSSRIVDHTTFAELQWRRDPFSPSYFQLPPGFQALSHSLPKEFGEVLEDVYALQCIRDFSRSPNPDILSMAYINNHQASIQSRLLGIGNISPMLECCRLAAYLCSSMLCCKVWCALVIPSHVSLQLLRKLQQTNDDPMWDDQPDLLLWLLYIGGAFAQTGIMRSDYVVLLHGNISSRLGGLFRSWLELLGILKKFIWSDEAFMPQVKGLWKDVSPLKIGNVEVKHRIGMPSLTRFRADDQRVPTSLMKEYYGQRAAVPGTLIIAEGTFVSQSACGGFPNAPGIWSQDQVTAWRAITDEVHSKGCFIFCQLFAMGRAGDIEVAKKEGINIVAPSALPIDKDSPTPQAMTIEEIKQTVEDFAKASENAISAGFDGVECHGANGYLLDQFIQDVSNTRDDEYGGSVENRSRLISEIMEAMVSSVGSNRVGLRLSPWSLFQGMRMDDPIPQFTDIVNKASQFNLAYLHLVESRVSGSEDAKGDDRLDFAYDLWKGPILVAGGYNPAEAQKLVDEEHPDKDIVVMFGRHFIANPDLVYRIKEGLELSAYNRSTFYVNTSPVGYVDYPLSVEYLESEKVSISTN